MSQTLHVVCPHCDTTNRIPSEKLAAGGPPPGEGLPSDHIVGARPWRRRLLFMPPFGSSLLSKLVHRRALPVAVALL